MNSNFCRVQLVQYLVEKQSQLTYPQVEQAVKLLFDQIITTLAQEGRVEVRGFGSINVHKRIARLGRNPKTGESVHIATKLIPHYKPSKLIKEQLNTL